MIELPVIPATQTQRKPDWLRVKLPVGKEYRHVRGLVDEHKLHTICRPNKPFMLNVSFFL